MKRNVKLILFACLILLSYCVLAKLVALFLENENKPLATNFKFITFHWTDRWGIGNEMYALASTIGINSNSVGSRVVCFDRNAKIRNIFDLNEIPKCSATYLKESLKALTYHETNYAKFDPRVNQIPPDYHVILDRFFQSWKYFQHENDFIRKIYKFNKDIDSKAEHMLLGKLEEFKRLKCKLKKCSDIILIAVHVRRKDLAQEHLKQLGYTTPSIEYYKDALQYFTNKHGESNTVFIVSSDNMEWAKLNLNSLTDKFIFIESNDPALDMAILSKCNHTIISVGTFGWWSAWLANGTTVYYKNWPVKDSSLHESTDPNDYFPASWIPL